MGEQSGSPRNALARSRSPYLLQHASNPVDWMEWGEEAFAAARRRDAPIFLSIGYSTCHWCHVMAHESFEDETIAARLNEAFVNVKLDREERPDVDRIYMGYIQATTGSGGWPMSVWLTPDLKPFYGGTYFPPDDKGGRVGFRTLIDRIAQLWQEERATLEQYGEKSVEALQQNAVAEAGEEAPETERALLLCFEQLGSEYDPENGGFGHAPKFPMPGYFQLLLEEAGSPAADEGEALQMLSHSLEKMARGGIWDHLGGGFHRYSVDQYWHVPHFEKMLYDQGQLAGVYAETYRRTGDERFLDVARSIVAYLERDLRGPEGQLYAAEDADSPLPGDPSKRGEGAFYVWAKSELDEALGEDAALFAAAYGVKEHGNARPESDPHGELTGMNTLIRTREDEALAAEFQMSPGAVVARLAECRSLLLQVRAGRPRPHLDDKTIVSWNGLAISGACKVYQAGGCERALDLARAAGDFLSEVMWDQEDSEFRRSYRLGLSAARGFAEDYASAANAYIDLYESTFDAEWLVRAKQALEQLHRRFADTRRGGFFATEADDASMIVRLRDDYDGAEPAASSVAAIGMLRLGGILDDGPMKEGAQRAVQGFAQQWSRSPRSMPLMLVAASRLLRPEQQIVIVGDHSSEQTQSLARVAHRWRKPNSIMIVLEKGGLEGSVLSANEKLQPMVESSDGPTAYLCENYACQAPASDARAFERQLAR